MNDLIHIPICDETKRKKVKAICDKFIVSTEFVKSGGKTWSGYVRISEHHDEGIWLSGIKDWKEFVEFINKVDSEIVDKFNIK